MYKVLRCIDHILDVGLFIFFLLLVIICGYTLYDTLLIYNRTDSTNLKQYKPNITDDGAYEWNIDDLTDDVVAWLTIDDTTIDYPVMQSDNNSDYLNKDPFGNYSVSGSIFLDFRNSNDFSDEYSLIYGHHMEYGKMFGALDRYLDIDYYNDHRKGTLIVSDQSYDIEFFAVVEADATTKEIFKPTEVPLEETLEYIRDNACIYQKPKEGRLIALSTCKFPETTFRIIILGVIQ